MSVVPLQRPAKPLSIDQQLAAYVRYLETERGLAAGTIRAYRREMGSFLRSGKDVREWLYGDDVMASTVTRKLAAVRSWCRFSRIPDLTEDISRPKRRQGLPRPVADIEAKIAAMEPVFRAVCIFLSQTGLRISEACAVKAMPVPQELMVRGKGSKDRLIPLSPRARAALTLLGGGMPYGPRAIQRRCQKEGFTPHQLRHTAACRWAAEGADLGEIQDLLGHSSPATSRVYTAYSLDRLRRVVNRT